MEKSILYPLPSLTERLEALTPVSEDPEAMEKRGVIVIMLIIVRGKKISK